MSTSLTKLYVRFIQTQTKFSLLHNKQPHPFESRSLYIKDNTSFYLINNEVTLSSGDKVTLSFNTANDYLKSMKCKVETTVLEEASDEKETALLFFNMEPRTVKQILLLTIVAIEEKS